MISQQEEEHYRPFGVLHPEEDRHDSPQGEPKKKKEEEEGDQWLSSDHKRAALLRSLQRQVGELAPFSGPYKGEKQLVYCDWTASGRVLWPVECYLQREVLPYYGNTHTTASRSGHQSTCYRHEARQIIAEAVNAKITGKAALDMVLFTGNGTTSAIHKLVMGLGLHIPLPATILNDEVARERVRPVVFVSSYEHHSNLLPWREAAADVVIIRYSTSTGVCLQHLGEMLEIYQHRSLKIGSFAAASNVTGLMTDVDAVSICMHRAGGIVFFDYATAAPYVKIDMNPVTFGEDSALAYKDAIVFSGHKFLGGPGSPGVLVAKKRLLPPPSEAPTASGGGTVFYVTHDSHRYLSNREEREEGGTPGIIGDIRMGLAMHLKQSIGPTWIEQKEIETAKRIHSRLAQNPAIHLLGHPHPNVHSSSESGRFLPIVSFLIQPVGSQRLLHYNFVCSLLNDLFGIQSRGGCMCAGPYSQLLLGIPSSLASICDTSSSDDMSALEKYFQAQSDAIENAMLDKEEVLRPGFTRLSLPYFMPEEKIEYVLQAIEFIAEKGVLFLADYRYNHRTGEYAHTTRLTRFPERKWLTSIDMESCSKDQDGHSSEQSSNQEAFTKMLTAAEDEANRILKTNTSKLKRKGTSQVAPGVDANSSLNAYEDIRWFTLPSDFPQSLPIIKTEDPDHSLRSPLQGPLQPNALLEVANDPSKLATLKDTCLKVASSMESGGKSVYAKKRDKKLVAWSSEVASTTRRNMTDAPTPRYVHPEEIIKSRTKTNMVASKTPSSSLETASTQLKCPSQPVPDSLSTTSTVENHGKQLLLGGNGKLFQNKEKSSSSNNSSKNSSSDGPSDPKRLITPPKKLLKTVGQAISDWKMIEDGDRVLLGLSGGKDSLCLLHILRHFQRVAPIRFTLACATVDPQTDSFDPSPLIPYLESLGVKYHYLSEPIVEMAKSRLQGDSLCAFCARFKRGLLYSCCREHQYNKLVLAQHLDDLAESFLMSALHNGQIRTMKANYPIDNESDDIRVIRPLVYTREQATRDFSLSNRLPVINENCPACFEEPKERARMKKLLSQEESMIPSLFNNMRRALTPLMHEDIYVAMEKVNRDIEKLNALKHKSKGNDKHNNDSNAKRVNQSGPEEASATKRTKLFDGKESSSNDAQAKCSSGYCAPCYELA